MQEIIQIAERYEKIGNLMHCTHSPQQILSQKLPCQAWKPLHVVIARKTTIPQITASAIQHLPPSQKANAMPSPQPEITICRKFNMFHKANCELPHDSCKFNHQHKCLVCKQYKCKQLKHSAHSSVVNGQSTPEPDKTDTILQQMKQLSSSVSTMSVRVSALEAQTQMHTSQTTSETVQPHNQATVDIAQPHVIGFPAVSEIQSCVDNSDPNLANKYIL